MPDILEGTVATTTSVTRTQSGTVGSAKNEVVAANNYTLNSVSGPVADVLWVSNRSVTGGQTETLNLLSLAESVLGATGIVTMRQVRLIRVANAETTTGPRIIVGPSGTNGWGRVAGDVGPGGELLAIQQTHAWGVTSTECGLSIRATGTTGPVAYSIVIAGTATTGPAGY